ncbi:hypothetical protein GGS20DRAFT_589632 [Poronia punctata]|nr:hypothetical protein GGS20DRAFT_589632 [Poronia punctata]
MYTSSQDPVAIIGTACRLPGGATSPSKLWSLLCEPRDLSRRIPKDRFDPGGFYHPDTAHHGTTNVTNAYLLEEDHRQFDSQFFQINSAEADCMDPQQRILLETVYEAIEPAGLSLQDLRGTDTAVFVGAMSSDYTDIILRDACSLPTYTSTGTARSMLSSRISYTFDWRGPSTTIDTACSSSLVALHEAVQALRTGVSRVAVASGANIILGPEAYIAGSNLSMLSPTVVKRLADALADGDDIEGVIRGSGVNQDGRTKGITVPSSESQEALMRRVYRDAGLDLEKDVHRCQYFEAHGTGTPVGDPIEASAIYNTFFAKEGGSNHVPLFVGSVKTVVGHTEGAAGLAGVLKMLLALKKGLIPPNLHLQHLNPQIQPYSKALKVPTLLEPWPVPPSGAPRRASVHSFGFGGTNAHVIIESPPGSSPATSMAIAARSWDSLISQMTEIVSSKSEIGIQSTGRERSGGILGIFTGQGAQWPLCTAVQLILVDLLHVANITFAAVVGHSSGEIAAAYAAGYISDSDAIYISYFRGFYSHLARGGNDESGAMMAVGTDMADAEDLCAFPELQGRLTVAAVNSSTSVTLSGDEDAVMLAKMAFEDEGKFTRMLKFDKAYHSHHMLPCSDRYVSALAAHIKPHSYNRNIGATGYSSVYQSGPSAQNLESYDSTYWNLNMVLPVLFSQAVSRSIGGNARPTVVIEIGPHLALKEPVLQTMKYGGIEGIPYISMLRRGHDSLETVSGALGAIWAHAGESSVNFRNIVTMSSRKPTLVKSLPTYPWDRQRVHWYESQSSKAFRQNSSPPHVLLGARLPESSSHELRWRNMLSPREVPWLEHHKLQGEVVFPAAGYVSMAIEASMCTKRTMPVQSVEVQDLVIERPMTFENTETTVEKLVTLTGVQEKIHDGMIEAQFHCYTTTAKNAIGMIITARGRTPEIFPMVDADSNRLYGSLRHLGYGYTGPFQGLSAIKRRFGASRAVLAKPDRFEYDNPPLLVPPTLLDCAFQSIFVAYGHPGDGMIRTLHVPNSIRKIIVNTDLMRKAWSQNSQFSLEGVLTPSPTTPVHGDIMIYASEPGEPSRGIISVEGLCAVPVPGELDPDDRKLFQDVLWGSYEPNVQFPVPDSPEQAIGTIATRISFRYPRLNILEVSLEAYPIADSIAERLKDCYQSYIMHSRIRTLVADLESESFLHGLSSQDHGIVIVSRIDRLLDVDRNALSKLHMLMKPGGYLLTTIPANEQVKAHAHAEPVEYKEFFEYILRGESFSGIDSAMDLQNLHVVCSQAVDHRILALRDPLTSTPATRLANTLYILYDNMDSCAQLVAELKSLTWRWFDDVVTVGGLTAQGAAQVPGQAVILSLLDLRSPLLKNIASDTLEALKALLGGSRTIL